ncbi:hypothetical protein R1sor_000747 [Riccia sorocarpa]|uniref:Uncharacterized protein n=1 Tax=Riccia sorocarpa TaxID=122646 RepID=A0ABD3GTZ9_9MARC
MVNVAVAARFFLLDRLEDDMFKRLAFFLAGRPHDVYTKTAVQGRDHLYLFINFKTFTSRKDLNGLNLTFTSASNETFSTENPKRWALEISDDVGNAKVDGREGLIELV